MAIIQQNHNLIVCRPCKRILTTVAYEKHKNVHDPTGRKFECHDGCAEHYFETEEELQEHCEFLHQLSTPSMKSIENVNLSMSNEHQSISKVDQPVTNAEQINPPISSALKLVDYSESDTSDDDEIAAVVSSAPASPSPVAKPPPGKTLSPKDRQKRCELSCTVCSRWVRRDMMPKHMEQHDSTDKLFTCTFGCPQTFYNNERSLRAHNGRYHREEAKKMRDIPTFLPKMATCQVCKETMTENNMAQHMIAHDPEGRPFKCDNGCTEMYFRTLTDLKNHTYRLHKEADVYLKSTPVTVVVEELFDNDDQSTIGDVKTLPKMPLANSVTCTVCSKEVANGSMESHMTVHDADGKEFECSLGCTEYYFRTDVSLKAHVEKVHTYVLNDEDETRSPNKSNPTVVPSVTPQRKRRVHVESESDSEFESDNESSTSSTSVDLGHATDSAEQRLFSHKKPRSRLRETLRKKQRINCHICNKSVTVGTMPTHMKLHSPTGRPFKCTKGCTDAYFLTESRLQCHIETRHQTEQLTEPTINMYRPTACKTCGKTVTKMNMLKHMKVHSPIGRPYKCLMGCKDAYFVTKTRLRHHTMLWHGAVTHTAPTMAKYGQPTSEQYVHWKRPHTCQICDKTVLRVNMKSHMKVHDSKGKSFQCERGCVRTFYRGHKGLVQHYGKEHGDIGAISVSNGVEVTHVATEEPSTRYDKKEVITKRSRQRKMLDAEESTDESADETEKSDSPDLKAHADDRTSDNLAEHMELHDATDKTIKCLFGCPNTFFSNERSRVTHDSNYHPGERRKLRPDMPPPERNNRKINCHICNKSVMSETMKKHMKLHSPTGRPFKCSKGCTDAYFLTKSRLQRHVEMRHTTVLLTELSKLGQQKAGQHVYSPRPTACEICGKTMLKTNMKSHMIVHDSKGKSFQCERGCARTFYRAHNGLMAHYGREHCDVGETPVSNHVQLEDQAKSEELKAVSTTDMTRHDATDKLYQAAGTRRRTPGAGRNAQRTCTVCSRSFRSDNLTKHMKQHDATGKSLKCLFGCQHTFFANERSRSTHDSNYHSGERKNIRRDPTPKKTVNCHICNKTILAGTMKTHMKLHSSIGRPYKCLEGCTDAYFLTEGRLKKHIAIRHKTVQLTKLIKSKCGQPSTGQHVHGTRLPIACAICRKTMLKVNMASHMKLHDSKGKDFQCDKGCVRTFYRQHRRLVQHYAKQHPEVKTGDQSISADHTADLSNVPMIKHQSTLSSNNSVVCFVCEEPITSTTMAAHMTSHDPTDKPYQCLRGCSRTYFAEEHMLKIHLSTQHGKKETIVEESRNRTIAMLDAEELTDESADEAEDSNNVSITAGVEKIELSPQIKRRRSTATGVCKICGQLNNCAHAQTHNPQGKKFKCVGGCVEKYLPTETSYRAHMARQHRYPHSHLISDDARVVHNDDNQEIIDKSFLSSDGQSTPLCDERTRSAKERVVTPNINVSTIGKDGRRAYKCTVCNRLNKGNHMDTHSPVNRPFMCTDGCVQTYLTTENALRMHRHRVHFIDKSVKLNSPNLPNSPIPSAELHETPVRTMRSKEKCTVCSLTIPLSALKRHMRTHSSTNRPFKCRKGCLTTFFMSSNALNNHVRNWHRDVAKTKVSDDSTEIAVPVDVSANSAVSVGSSPTDTPAIVQPKLDVDERRRLTIADMLANLPSNATDEDRLKIRSLFGDII